MAGTRSAKKELEKALEKALKKRETQNSLLAFCESKWRGHGTTPLTQIEVNHFIDRAQTIYNDYTGTHLAILNCEPIDKAPHEADWTSFIERCETLTCGLKSLITPGGIPIPTNAPAEIRLPRMELPSFSGDITEWTSFVDQFDAAVHNNPKISNAQKMTYLKSSVRGEAAKLLTHLSITDTNYDIAWKTLKGRFENEREMVFEILSRFFGQSVIKEESSVALRSLLDVSRECIRRLEKQQLPVDQWDVILVFTMLQKTDSTTRHYWELSSADTDLPKLEKFLDFLELRSRALAAGATRMTSQVKSTCDGQSSKKVYTHHGNGAKCNFCSGLHYNYQCPDFAKLDITQRKELIRGASLCFNCLREGHQSSNCITASRCKLCKSKHHTMIHDPKPQTQGESQSNQPEQNSITETRPPPVQARTLVSSTHPSTNSFLSQSEESSPFTCSLYTKNSHSAYVACESTQAKLIPGLLATALVKLIGLSNSQHNCRALLDPGSTISFITEAAVKRLGLKKMRTSVTVTGIGGSNCGTSSSFVSAAISPHFSTLDDASYTLNFLVRKSITTNLPLNSYRPDQWPHIFGLKLADPDFHKPGEIEMLLGTDIVWDLILDGKIHGPPGTPSARNSELGWLIAGNLGEELPQVLTHNTNINLDTRLQQFWELENVPSAKLLTKEELECERQFVSTFKQDDDGKFVVSLPFKTGGEELGASRDIAMRRLKSLERRLAGQPERRQQYLEFMREYESMGHMRILPPDDLHLTTAPTSSYYIPHHFVLKDVSNVKKFRVVFDASSKSTTGVSLNDQIMVGPTIQDSLVNILTKFRRHVVAFTADIAKMYRQIWMKQDDCDWQRILWRESPDMQVKDYRLLTVTYGTASAPFQATRALYQLAMNHQHSHPHASKVIMEDFYVDDLMSGAQSVDEAVSLITKLLQLCESVGFELTKWTSNHAALVSPHVESGLDSQQQLKLDRDDSTKTLGVYWNQGRDSFVFKVSLPAFDPKFTITKRALLSEMSMVFDPLGWLSPVTIRAKILFQKTWKENLGWDDPLPNTIQQEWLTYRENLNNIESCELKRCIYPSGTNNISIHGFCDASEQAYSAVVYLRAEQQDKPPLISLIMAKTRVAPSKQITLPRLELCGALHLSKLLESVQTCLKLEGHETFAWSDSTVVLDWINSHPHRWKTFVANRVAEIQSGVPTVWCHVKGVENPADCASRGIDPTELSSHPLWWHGPDWLSHKSLIPQPWKTTTHGHLAYVRCRSHDEMMAQEQRVVTLTVTTKCVDFSLLLRYSSLVKLKRVTAWCIRFLNNSRQNSSHIQGPLSADELNQALTVWIKNVQSIEFQGEIDALEKNMDLPRKSRLLSLNPFLDSSNILRVGGRLRHSKLDADRKHPILLPRHHHLTRLIIIHDHVRNFHGGCQLTLSTISQKFWILGARDAIRHQIKKCMACTRLRGSTMQQMMANLPEARVTPTRAFQTTGVDYAGPFFLKPMSTRSKASMKSYMALFVCFIARAIHLELVSSLTTDAFLAALKRFVGRRGRPSTIHSDCGTNFIGASRELKELLALVTSPQHNVSVSAYLATDGIEWRFNPPGAPHFGGLWEAGVKSVKHHLYRSIGSTRQSFEELSTILVQVESCLNSRPLTPCSTDPNDLTALTPGHFLIGTALNAIPEPDLTTEKVNRLSRWQFNQSVVQRFWLRWSKEYLSRLQQRPKWLHHRSNIKIDDMVLIKVENLPPLKWKLGRVVAVHPGPDGIIRVATVKTAEGDLKRPIVKLSLLPMDTSVSLSESDNFNHI